MKYYAGVGSRQTPRDILDIMRKLGYYLSEQGYTLRSGGAQGADRYFEMGANTSFPIKKDIFRPEDATTASMELAAQYHPAWNRCGGFSRKAHGRNTMIMLGRDLTTPVSFVMCWTPGGGVSGGTGQALRIALAKGIKIYNLYDVEVVDRVRAKME